MRISGGEARGIPLEVPKGDSVRPATDGLRQAVFSSLGMRVAQATFLDLFAGSGAYGLEALSRGASQGAWIERNARTVVLLRKNLAAVCRSLGRDELGLQVVEADALSVAPTLAGEADLIFADPPYEAIDDVAPVLFARLGEAVYRAKDPLFIFEMPGDKTLVSPGWKEVKRIGRGARQPTAVIYRPA